MGTFWLGRNVFKCPTDLWVYQKILHDTRPDLILETGTFSGGSALFLASVCDRLGRGRFREDRVMVILDSDHSRDHVLAELREYSSLVSEGCYLIVEDTTARLLPDHGPGPDEAIEEFLKENDSFVVDGMMEKFLLTFNPGGFLRRRRSAGA